VDFEALQAAFGAVFLDYTVLLTILVAAVYGIFMGAVPGLTATMAVALLIPLTYHLEPTYAFAAVVSLVACAIFAGDIPTTLVRMPGTPASAAYSEDAYALARAGRARQTLVTALVFSVVGGVFGALVLMFLARPLASIAVQFTYFEYFWLYVLGLSCAAVVSRGSPAKGALALLFGLFVSTIGLGAVYSTPRFTFGNADLKGGIEFLPAMIGLFGMSEVLRNAMLPRHQLDEGAAVTGDSSGGSIWSSLRERFARRKRHTLRSASIGSVVGMLPGAGGDIGAWVSFAASKKSSKNPDEYGKGSLDGISDATAANNSAIAGAWVPALVFGIPGDSVTALVISVFYMKKIVPGPAIFENPEQAKYVYSIYVLFIAANLILIPVGYAAIKLGTRLVLLPRRVLLPCITLFTIVGAYASRQSFFDVWVMLAFGIIGFLLERRKFPLGLVVLGLVLGKPLEEKLIQGLVASGGSPLGFFSRPIAATLGILTISLWVVPFLLRRRRAATTRQDDAS